MGRPDITKREMKELRALAGEAYRRELDGALRDIASAFTEWEAGKLDGFTLSDRIHEFHNGIARELWRNYNYVPTTGLIYSALARGVLTLDEIPAALQERFRDVSQALWPTDSAEAPRRDEASPPRSGVDH